MCSMPPCRLCLISDKHNIGIISNLIEKSVIECNASSGLGFVNVNVLKIRNIEIQGCGASILPLADRIVAKTGPYLSNTSYASLAIVDSSEVSLSSVTIWEYYGYAILAVNVYGMSELSELDISSNNNTWTLYGSGVMVYYHNSKPASLIISKSQFLSNNLFAISDCLPDLLSPLSNSTPIPTPYASALSIVYNQVSQNVSVTLSECFIIENIGLPVVLILYYDSLPNVTTSIRNNSQVIYNQEALSKCHGTGFAMLTYFSKSFAMKYEKSHMSITSDWTSLSVSQSIINLGMFNSERQSVLYLSTTQIKHLLVHVVFQNVQFQYNSAAEVVYAETILTSHGNFKSLAVHFTDVVVDGNIQNQVTKDYWYMPGAILTFVNLAAVYLFDSNFTRNIGSVIEAYDTDVYMSGNVSFQYNSGSNGAALLLLGQSYLFLYLNLTAEFKYNTYKYGGAIYSFGDRAFDNNCTFQVLSRNLSKITEHSPLISFVDNIASIGHSSVSAISISKCHQMNSDINSESLYSNIFDFEDDYINSKDYSHPARIVPCVKGEPQHINIHPGEIFNISLAASNVRTSTSVQVHLYHGQNLKPSSWWLSDCEQDQVLDKSETCSNISLTIHTKHLDYSNSRSTAFFSFPNDVPTYQTKIVLKPCPPGFQLNNHIGICECSSLIESMNKLYKLNFTCDIQNIVVKVPNSEPWIGCYNMSYNNSNSNWENNNCTCEVGISPSCFRGFCNYSVPQWMPSSANICIDSREGALCGSCIGNYSTVFGSNKCFPCSHWSLFTILIYAAAGLLLIILLFSVELTISTGTINGLIFFANLWNTGFSEILEYQNQNSWFGLSQVYIALLNLGLGYPLCFYDGMKEIVKSWLQLVFPVYLLVLVALVVIVSRYSMRVSSLVYSRAVPVLVTVVHLSVSRLFLAAVDAFSIGLIYTDSNINDKPKYVWLRDGNNTYFSPLHAVLAIVSLALAAVFILPYLILLLGARWWIKFKTINLYLKPILDAAHGPFKDDKQYWFGLRLILLLQQLIVFVAVGEYSETYVYWINGPILIVFTIMHASAQPFKSKAVNMLDGLIMIVLCLVVYACSVFALKDNLYLTELVTLSSLATVVFLVFMAILSYHVLLVVLLCCSKHLKSSFAKKAYQYLASFIRETR